VSYRVGRAWVLLVLAGTPALACDELESEPSFVPSDFLDSYPEVRDCRYSVDHDGVYVRVYVDPAAEGPYVEGDYPFAPGTIVVKRYFTDAQCSNPDGYAAMQKLATGDDPEQLDWRWQELDEELRVIDTDVPRCVSCHQSCTMGRDGVCTDP
jgi:hypothetical protein